MNIRNMFRRWQREVIIRRASIVAKELGQLRKSDVPQWDYRDDQIAIWCLEKDTKWNGKAFHVTIEWRGQPVAEYWWDRPFGDFSSEAWERFNPGDWCDYVHRLYKPIDDEKTRDFRARFEDAP